MFRLWIFSVLTTQLAGSNVKRIGLRYPPTQGEVWPKPQSLMKTNTTYNVDLKALKFTFTGKSCLKVESAVQRCKDFIATLEDLKKLYNEKSNQSQITSEGKFKGVEIHLTHDCESYPHYDMDESYSLKVFSKAVLKSSSVWGIIRGMETLSQLFYLTNDFQNVLIHGVKINDRPNYIHRGLLLDTGRNYVSVEKILKTLDAMAMNKMNVFHWHIVDDESFPYQSAKFPEFGKLAYHSSLIYTRKDLEKIRDHAAHLGIRVIMEFDMPGHVDCWRLVHPEIITKCDDDGDYAAPLNPVKSQTYHILEQLLQEVQDIFPEKFFHLGGNEVKLSYYLQDPDIKLYMKENNITLDNVIHALFFEKVFGLLKNGTTPVVWNDVYDNKVPLPKSVVVQVWYGDMAPVLESGYRAILSIPYQLNHLIDTFWQFYENEPRLSVKSIVNNKTLENVLGGEACMWGEMMDGNNLLSRVWPRASAVAEVLWSQTEGKGPDVETRRRIQEHTCRMNRRGIPAEPATGPDFCLM